MATLPYEVEAVLLDFDGTIIDIRPKWWQPIEESFIEITGEVPEQELRKNVNRIIEDMPSKPSKIYLLKVIWRIGRSGGLGYIQTIRFIQKVRAKFRHSRKINRLNPGIEDLINYLREKDIPIAIVTTAERSEINTAIDQLEILENIPLITRDDVERLKPHAEPVIKALKLLNKEPNRTLFVGDFRTDIRAGKNAGTMTCGYLGVEPDIARPNLEKENPDLIIEELDELIKLI